MWTIFWDMHSGGGTKEPPYEKIYIEAPEEDAIAIFYNRFGHSPSRVSCTCCGDDYSISEEESIEQATAYHRNCRFAYFRPDGTECDDEEGFVIGKGTPQGYTSKYIEEKCTRYGGRKELISLSEYEDREDVLFIRANEVSNDEKIAEIPEQGYVWVD